MEKFIYAIRDTKTNKDVSLSSKIKKYYDIKGHAERAIRKGNLYYKLEPKYKLVTYKIVEVENEK